MIMFMMFMFMTKCIMIERMIDLVIFSMFDDTIERYDVYKVETVGDAYMVVSGLPEETEHHALHICFMALDLVQRVVEFTSPVKITRSIQIRVGIHSGNDSQC